jgi:hypothetical protein
MTTERSVQSDSPFVSHGKALHSAANRRNGCNSVLHRLNAVTKMSDVVCAPPAVSLSELFGVVPAICSDIYQGAHQTIWVQLIGKINHLAMLRASLTSRSGILAFHVVIP